MSTAVPSIFFSYARKDATEMQQLKQKLEAANAGAFRLFVDTSETSGLLAGGKFNEDLRAEIAGAALAILFITDDFLLSKYIRDVELPEILKRARRESMILFPVIAKACAWEQHEEIKALNLRPIGASPVWSFENPPYLIDHILVGMAKEIKGRILRLGRATHSPTAESREGLQQVHMLDGIFRQLHTLAVDDANDLWASDGQQIRVFSLRENRNPGLLVLPNVRWKSFLLDPVRKRLLISDWNGAIHRHAPGLHADPEPWLPACGSPVHCMAIGPVGEIVAAAWDGTIRRWDTEGRTSASPCRVSALPLHLLPLANGFLLVADQLHCLRLFDVTGKETWRRQMDSEIVFLRACQDGVKRAFILQCGAHQLVKMCVETGDFPPITFPSRIACIGHSGMQEENEWFVVAREDGTIDWVVEQPFQIMRDSRIEVDFAIRSIAAIRDPLNPSRRVSIGVTADGRLFNTEEQRVTISEISPPAQEVVLDRSGRFLFVLCGRKVRVFRNPGIQSMCQASFVSAEGELQKGKYGTVAIRLKNSGYVTIWDAKAELFLPGQPEPSPGAHSLSNPVKAGDAFEIVFHACPLVSGILPATLSITLGDEAGIGDAGAANAEFRFSITARDAP